MFYYMYQITNTINGKIYVGVHKTKSLDDGYMGSGKVIKSAIAKHGIMNFEKVILEFFGTSEAMYVREKEVVNEEFLLREDVYNLRRGGFGGFDYINENNLHFKGYESAADRNKHISPFSGERGNDIRLLASEAITEDVIKRRSQTFVNSGKSKIVCALINDLSRTPESNPKRSNTMKEKTKGDKNSQYGTMWIYSETEKCNMKIKKSDSVPEDWIKGRKMKF